MLPYFEQGLELYLVLFIALPAVDILLVIFFAAAPITAPVILLFVILGPPALDILPCAFAALTVTVLLT